MDANEFLKRYTTGERDFSEADLSKVNLKKANLSGASFVGANLSEAKLCEANLSGAELVMADLSGADLSKVDFSGADLSGVVLQGATLWEANLSGAKLSEVDLSGVELTGANLSGVNLREINLSRANLIQANLKGTILTRTNFKGANLTKANLEQADLEGANLEEARLSMANLQGANFKGANLKDTALNDTDFNDNDFKGANLNEADLNGIKLRQRIYLEKENLNRTKIHDTPQISPTSLPKAPTVAASLNKSLLSECSENANNQGIQFALNNKISIWNDLRFRSKSEIKIAEALDRVSVLFYPNCKARLDTPQGRDNKESDFLVFYKGKWGILEVDGEEWHPPSRTVHDHKRDRLFKAHGICIVEHYDATECFEKPNDVVQEFLEILSRA